MKVLWLKLKSIKIEDQEKVEWAVHQMLSTTDYAQDNTFENIKCKFKLSNRSSYVSSVHPATLSSYQKITHSYSYRNMI